MSSKIVLLVGSDDDNTRKVLSETKQAVAKAYSGSDIYCFILEDIYLYAERDYDIIVEKYDAHYATIFIFDRAGNLLIVDDFQITDYFDSLQDTYKYLLEWTTKTGRDTPNMPAFITGVGKIESLFKIARASLLIKEEEKTDGEEYVKFLVGISKYKNKSHFLMKDKIILSEVMDDVIRHYKIPATVYNDRADLLAHVIGLLNALLI